MNFFWHRVWIMLTDKEWWFHSMQLTVRSLLYSIKPFLPRGVYSGWGIVVTVLVRTYVRTYVRPYVRPKFFLRFLFFWDPHVGSSWRFFHFLKKMIFWACHALFLTIFLIYKGLLGARCKSGDLCWKGFVCRFWIYIVVRPDLFFAFLKKAFVSPAD